MGTKQYSNCLGVRGKAIALALKSAKPIPADFKLMNDYRQQRTAWERCVHVCMKEFELTNTYFPKRYFLDLAGFDGSFV